MHPLQHVGVIAFWSILAAAITILAISCFVMVREKSFKTTTLFGGKYFRTLKPGIHLNMPWPIAIVDRSLSTRIAELPLEVHSLTKDRAKITLSVRVQYKANENKAYEAAYMLEDAEDQIKSYIENTIRSEITAMTVE